MTGRPLVPLLLLIVLQGIDVLVHVAADQVEPIRIAGNVIIAVGAVVAFLAARAQSTSLILVSGAAYLVLNIVFLAQHGLTNPASGALRVPLFGFVIASLAILQWFRRAIGSQHSA